MPKPTVLIGPPGPVRDEVFFSRVTDCCAEPASAATLRYVVPTARHRLHVLEEILDSCSANKVICEPRVETLDHLVALLFEAHGARRLIGWRTAGLVIDALLTDRPGDFPALHGGRTTPFPGLVQAVLRSIRELKRFALGPHDVQRAAHGDPKALDLAELFRRYTGFLDEQQWADVRDAYLAIGCDLGTDAALCRLWLPGVEWIVFDGFVEFSPSETPIVNALVEQLETTFIFDNDPALPDLFPALPELAAELTPREHAGAFVPVARLAWQGSNGTSVSVSAPVKLIEAGTREEEVEQIASRIKTLLRDGVAQADIAVAVPDFVKYADLVDETFAEHGVPCTISRAHALADSPVTAVAFLMLEVPARDFERDLLVRLFRSPFVHSKQDAHAVDPAPLESLARATRVFRGREAWSSALARRIAYLENVVADPASEAARDDEAPAGPPPEVELDALRSLERPLLAVLDVLDALRASRSAAQYTAALQHLLDDFGVRTRVAELGATVADASSHLQSLAELVAVLNEIERVDKTRPQSRTMALDDFIELLRSAVAATHVATTKSDCGVEVADFRTAVERRTKHLFVAGLVEGAVPVPRPGDALLGPSVRARFGLPPKDRVDADRWIELYRLLASASDTLHLCHPMTEGETPLLRPAMLERIEAAIQLCPEPPPPSPTSWRRLLRDAATREPGFPALDELLGDEAFTGHDPLAACAHGVAVEKARRASPAIATPYAGQLSAHLLDEVRRTYGRDHQFSANELDTYVRCPFRFFAQRVLGLAEPTEPEEEITPRDKGDVLHAIFRDFYRAWRVRGHTTMSGAHLGEALDLLLSVAAKRLDELPYQGPIWQKFRERLIGHVSDDVPVQGLFHRFLEEEAKTADAAACSPSHFEIGFGQQRHHAQLDPDSKTDPFALQTHQRRILLHGVIDRLDTNAGDKTYCVLDYKSGHSLPALKDIRQGISLQLPIYVMAAKHLLGDDYHFAAAGYLQTKDAKDCGRKNWFGDSERAQHATGRKLSKDGAFAPAQINEWLGEERDRIGQCVDGIERGRFHVTSLDDHRANCRLCEFKHICRSRGITLQTFEEYS